MSLVETIAEDGGFAYDDAAHRYTVNGIDIPSVTSILSSAGLSDYSHVDLDVLERKRKFGTKVHKYCQWLDEGDFEVESLIKWPDYYNSVMGWKQFSEDFGLKVKVSERQMAVRVNGMLYGMTADCYGKGKFGPNGEEINVIAERKTTCKFEYSVGPQTAAYAIPFSDETHPVKRIAVRLLTKPVNGRLYSMKVCDDSSDERVFMSALFLEWTRINNKLK